MSSRDATRSVSGATSSTPDPTAVRALGTAFIPMLAYVIAGPPRYLLSKGLATFGSLRVYSPIRPRLGPLRLAIPGA
jgi:hypothetical protein